MPIWRIEAVLGESVWARFFGISLASEIYTSIIHIYIDNFILL